MSLVKLYHFDSGIITTLGSVLVDVTVDGGARKQYAIEVEGVTGPPQMGGKVPVYFTTGRSAYNPKLFPCIVIRRTSMEPAFMNGGAHFHTDWKRAAPFTDTRDIILPDGETVSGPRTLEVKQRAIPYNLGYEITIRSRGDRAMMESAILFDYTMRICRPPGFGMTLKDSVGDERGYDVIVESISPNMEAFDITERESSSVISLMVHGEIDHDGTDTVPAFSVAPNLTFGGV